MEALVLRMGVASGILNTSQQARRPSQKVGEGLDEPDRAPRSNQRRLAPEAGLESSPGSVEGGPLRVCFPPGRAPHDAGLDPGAVGWAMGEVPDELVRGLSRVPVGHR